MVGFPRPVKMKVMKVTAPKKYERSLLSALQNTKAVELINVEWTQPHERTQLSPQEQEVGSLLQKLNELIEFLEISAPPMFSPKKRILIVDRELDQVLSYAQVLVNQVSKLQDEWVKLESQQEDLQNTLRLAEAMVVVPEMLFEDVGEGPLIDIIAGTMKYKDTQRLMWQLEAATNENYFFVEQYVGEGDSVIIIATPNAIRSRINQILSFFGVRTFVIPSELKGKASEVIIKIKQDLERIQGELKELDSEKEKLVEKYQRQLLAAHEALKIEVGKIEAKTKIIETETGISLWAWVSVKELKQLTKAVKEVTNNEAKIQTREPDLPEEAYPTHLENSTLVKPLEELTKSYGAPGYRELDPSIFMAFAFPIIFGIMFADVGHGLILLLMGLGGIISKRSGVPPVYKGMGDELKGYFKKGGWLLFFCGVFSILFGFIFGSFFGMEEFILGPYEFKPLWFSPAWEANSEHLLHAPGGPYKGISGTILMLELSLVVGIVHITVGLLLKFYGLVKEGKKLEALYFPVMLIIFYFTAFLMAFTYDLNPTKWMQKTDPTPFTFGLLPHFTPVMPSAHYMFFGGFLLPIVVMMLPMMKIHGMEGLSEVFDFVLSLISHTLSYSRILAINKVHAILSALFLTEPFLIRIPGITHIHTALTKESALGAVGLEGIIIQCLMIMTLETMISFLQALRLNWVEFFSKWYEGRGHMLKPIGYIRRFTSISTSK